MKKHYKLGVIGCSLNTTSILRGVILSDFIREKKIIVADTSEDKLDELNFLGVDTTTDARFVAENSEYVLFAVKPKRFEAVAAELEGVRPEKVISIMDGISKSEVKNALGVGLIKVARACLNLPCSIGSGAVGLDMTDFNKFTDDTEFISKLFLSLGTVVSVEEKKLAAASALVASGPVYALMFIDGLISAGIKQGLSRSEAKTFAAQTVLGTAETILRDEKQINELIMQACNDGGASVNAVKTLQDGGLEQLLEKAVSDCVKTDNE